MRGTCRLILVLAVLVTLLWPGRAPAENKRLVIATATTGGTFYPVGVAIGTLISLKLAKDHGLTATAEPSAGSGENLALLREGKADLAILQALYGQNAFQGIGAFQGDPFHGFAAVSMLWENVEHFILRANLPRSGSIEDLKGLDQPFSLGPRESGSEGSSRVLLKAVGVDPDTDLVLTPLDYSTSAKAVVEGSLAGASLPGGPPVTAVSQIFAQATAQNAVILEITDTQLEAIQKSNPIWSRYIIEPGTYPGQDRPVRTASQPNVLVCRADMDEETVYLITRTIYENLPFLQSIHDATRAMRLDRATQGLPAPLHPGAARYFREVGALP